MIMLNLSFNKEFTNIDILQNNKWPSYIYYYLCFCFIIMDLNGVCTFAQEKFNNPLGEC